MNRQEGRRLREERLERRRQRRDALDRSRATHPERVAQERAHLRRCRGPHKDGRCPAVPDPDVLAELWAGRARMARARQAAGAFLDDVDRHALLLCTPEAAA